MRRFILTLAVAAILAATLAAAPAFAQEASQQQYGIEERTLSFELVVGGTPPVDATFFGQGPLVGLPVRLVDSDGDGTYTGTTTVEVTVNPNGTMQPAPIAIFGGVGTTPGGTNPGSKFPGYSSLVVKDFGPTVIEDSQTLRATVSFDEDQGDGTIPGDRAVLDSVVPDSDRDADHSNSDEPKNGNGKYSSGTSVAKALPKTGGFALPIVGVADALLVGAGVLIRTLAR